MWMGRNWRAGVIGVVAVGVALLALGAGLGLFRNRTDQGRDGKVVGLGSNQWVRLWKVTEGPKHEWVLGRFPKLDPLRRKVPGLRAILGEMTEAVSPGYREEGLCVFYGGEDDAGDSRSADAWLVASYDEHGCRLPIESSRGEQTVVGRKIAYQLLTTYPRRARNFEVLFGESGSRTDDGVRMKLENPQPWKGTNWVPEAVPATRDLEGWRVTFLGFGGSEKWPAPRFRVAEDGRELPEWVLGKIQFRDVTGNHSDQPDLCRHEAAWQIEASFERDSAFDFGSDEAWTLWEGEFPTAGTAKAFQGSRVLHGVRVEAIAVGGPGAFDFQKGNGGKWVLMGGRAFEKGAHEDGARSGQDGSRHWYQMTKSKPWLMVELTGLTEGHTWHLGFRGTQGRFVRTRGWRGVGTTYTTVFEVPTGVAVSEVRVVVQRWRTVAFTVPPPKMASP